MFRIPHRQDEIPLSVKLSFYIGGVVFISAVLWTIIRTKEYSPEELAGIFFRRETSN